MMMTTMAMTTMMTMTTTPTKMHDAYKSGGFNEGITGISVQYTVSRSLDGEGCSHVWPCATTLVRLLSLLAFSFGRGFHYQPS
jgi:hypothetical protein